MKKLISAAISAALCISAAASVGVCAATPDISGVSVSSDKVTESGVCGAGTQWTYDNGKLTITGTGKMVDWEMNNDTPWHKFRPDITTVEIAEGVTNIGACAFAGCTSLTTYNIPKSATYLGRGAFEGCTKLTEVDVPDNIQRIGFRAFANCSSLRVIRIHNPNCDIVASDGSTISNSSSYGTNSYSGVIVGAESSTAKKFASDFGYSFATFGNEPAQTTTTTTTTTTTSTTTTTTTTTTTATTTTSAPVTTTTSPEFNTSFFLEKKIIAVGEATGYYTDGWPLDHIEIADTKIAVLENGQIKGLSEGTTDVTFYASKGGSNTCKLTVTKTEYPLGDVDGNGMVNAVDASYVLSEYADTSTSHSSGFSGPQKKAADVDINGAINATDASYILSYYVYTSTGTDAKVPLNDYIKQQLGK